MLDRERVRQRLAAATIAVTDLDQALLRYRAAGQREDEDSFLAWLEGEGLIDATAYATVLNPDHVAVTRRIPRRFESGEAPTVAAQGRAGEEHVDAGFDPRREPWYALAKGKVGTKWGRPFLSSAKDGAPPARPRLVRFPDPVVLEAMRKGQSAVAATVHEKRRVVAAFDRIAPLDWTLLALADEADLLDPSAEIPPP